MSRRRLAAAMLGVALAVGACTGAGPNGGPPSDPTLVPPTPEKPSPAPAGKASAQAALDRLCTVPAPKGGGGSDVPAEGPTPPAIATAMRQLEQIRGFGFSERVVAQPVTQREIAKGFTEAVERSFPEELYERRTKAWATIGVISPSSNIHDELLEFGSTQVIGYYDTVTGELVFLGGDAPSPLERVTLAHELTHAIDDQRFGLERVDMLGASCRDDEVSGALALIEGNATFFMYRWARTFLGPEEQLELAREAATQQSPPSDVEPFIQALQLWPYTEGLAFVDELERRGGIEAVDAAFEAFPVSSEQVIHPERYPNDLPTPVDVRDLSSAFGPGWEDLDVMHVGEAWLQTALGLRLDQAESGEAAGGWDGGLYRAFTDGDEIAIVLQTTWDSERDASEFADSMEAWIGSGEGIGRVLRPEASDVRVLFASDAATLDELEAVA